jgi:DNA polymerase-3 subunit delta
MHATAYLPQAEKHGVRPFVVLHGEEAHLKTAARRALCRIVLGSEEEGDLGLTRVPGRDAEWKSVRDELLTLSMFGDRRLVIVEDADEFVTRHRAQLEDFADKPLRSAVLVLDVKTWRKNTKLAKKVDAQGLELECSELTGGRLIGWLIDHARDKYDKQLTRDAATLITELAGGGLGLLDQELGKLAAYVGERSRIGAEEVRTLVGGWRAETTWKMTGAIRDGQPAVALQALDKLLGAGEAPQKVLGGISFVFRKYGRATELSRQGAPLRAALKDAGVFPHEIDASERYLRRVGRAQAEAILSRLLSADGDMKGGSRVSDRLQLERLVLQLAGV